MVQATIHFLGASVTVEFEGDHAFTTWLGFLKKHGMANAKLAGTAKSVIVFHDNISYIEADGDAQKLALA